MLPRKFRLPRSGFQGFRRKGGRERIIRLTHIAVQSLANNLGHNRYAIIIGGKAEKSAVRRHFWKRQIAVRLRLWPNIGRDVLVTLWTAAKDFSKEQLAQELDALKKEVVQTNPKSNG